MNEPLDVFDSAPDVLAGTEAALDDLAYLVGQRLASMGARIVTAESCTGGGIARALTERGGASVWFDRGFVTYSNQAKQDLLGVPGELLNAFGAVSEQVAGAMAVGALQSLGHSQTALALSVTGIAGPGGAVAGKPVGTVCFGWAGRAMTSGPVWAATATAHWGGDRASVRLAAAHYALREGLEHWLLNLTNRTS